VDNESYIQEAISELVKNKTLLVIAHRLNTIRDADNIVVIKEGNIAEQGNHEDLMNSNGIYKNMVELQEKNKSIKIL
jgi:ABC superfamily ATP binding cassette transporter, ABC/membrane protein